MAGPSSGAQAASDSAATASEHRPPRWVEGSLAGAPASEQAEGKQPRPDHGSDDKSSGNLSRGDDTLTSDTSVGSDAENETAGESEQSVCGQCGHAVVADDIFCGECGFVSQSVTSAFRPAPSLRDTGVLNMDPLAIPGLVSKFPDTDDDYEDVEETRIVSRRAGSRFVLQFSTGESVTVHGTGLVGRNPQPEPGEFFDHLVRIVDAGKSVSKTHLEFGQEGDVFWVKDRFSGNGTVIKEPETSARRAEANRRYRVVRGTRIDVGEQFFVVS